MPPITPNAPGAPPAGGVPMQPMELPTPEMTKSLDGIMGELGRLYQQCYTLEPDGPLSQAVMSIQKAVAEVGRSIGAPPEAMDAQPGNAGMDPNMSGPVSEPGMEGGMPPLPEEDPSMEMPPPTSLREAAGQTHDMTLAAAKRRQKS